MLRLDSSVSLMVATEEQAKAIERAIKEGPLALMASDHIEGEGFLVIVLDSSEQYADQAEEILG